MVVVFDLDDTLFPEMDFVRSSYREIARRHGRHLLLPMLEAPTPRAAFDSTGLPIEELLSIYRNHYPSISLPWYSLYTLAMLKKRGCKLGLITDGRSVTQRNKIAALGLYRFIDDDMIFISEERGYEKITGESFREIMAANGEENSYIYVGDNPKKDFLPGNKLGWTTVCLLGGAGGEGIFEQEFDKNSKENNPTKTIYYLTELLDSVNL